MAPSNKPVKTIALALIVSAVLFFGTTVAVAVTIQPVQAQEGYTTEPYQAITVNNENIDTVVNQEPAAATAAEEEPQPLVGPGGTDPSLSEESADQNCGDLTQRNFEIDPANDPSNLDADNDGVACEEGTAEVAVTEEAEPTLPVDETSAQPVLGNAVQAIEQIAPLEAFTAECLAQIDAAVGTIVELVLIEQNPEVEQAIEVEAEAAVEEAAADVPAEAVQVINEQVDEVVEAVNDTETQAAVEEQVNASEVAEEIVSDEIVEEIIELEEDSSASEEIDTAVEEAVVEVVTGESTPEDAVSNMTEEIIEIVEAVEVTPEEVTEAVAEVNATEVIVTATENNSTIEADVSDTVVESTEEVAAETGQSEETVFELLNQATELLNQAQHKLFGQEQ